MNGAARCGCEVLAPIVWECTIKHASPREACVQLLEPVICMRALQSVGGWRRILMYQCVQILEHVICMLALLNAGEWRRILMYQCIQLLEHVICMRAPQSVGE